MEATHRLRPNQDVGCGHSESNPVESPVCDANTATKVHRVSSYTEFSFSSSSSDDKFKNQKSPQSSSASNNSEKSAGYTDALLFDNLVCKFIFVQRSGKERCMFKGTISELQDFVSLVLEIDGYWRTGKDPNHNIFKSTCKNININYWISTQTFTVNGKKEDAIMKKIKQLVSSYKSPLRQYQEELTASNRVQSSQTMHSTTPCLQGNYATPETIFIEPEKPIPIRLVKEDDQRAVDSHKTYEKFGNEINRIWESVHTLSKRHKEILRLLDLLKAEKEDNKILHKVIEEKDALIKELCTAIAKPDSTFRQETNNNQDNKWEKPKSPAKRAFPPTWEPTTSNRFDCLNVDESKHDLDSNDPIQIQLTNVKLKRKIQYLQSKVKDSQPTTENIATGNFKPRTTSARCLSESTNPYIIYVAIVARTEGNFTSSFHWILSLLSQYA